ncbi:MAG: hypothetical protein K2K57_10965 [Oscillospiraceae bacterium]|nr:hypothetical protein [Oscillospiraceae bacterium]
MPAVLPDFYKIQQDKTSVPEWAKYMTEGEFISYSVSYHAKTLLDLFDEYTYNSPDIGDMTYYLYDPIKHGGDPHKKYPVLMWLHGTSNALDGVNCIMCCGAEQYASEKYQQEMGGAYIIVPLANEKRLESGEIQGSWNKNYSPVLKGIYDKVITEHRENTGKKFVMGASSGGYMTWHLLEDHPGFFEGAMPISSGYIPDSDSLDMISKSGIHLLIAHGRYDELAGFDECVAPSLEKLESLDNCICFFPKWVYNGDGGIASVHYGIEMGQHCMINWVQSNLIFDNGSPADERLPKGVTGWIRSVCGSD